LVAAVTTNRRAGVIVCALAYVVLFGYALARPTTESLFLEVYGSKALPEVWLAVAAAALGVVALYNRAAARFPLGKVMVGAITVSALSLAALVALHRIGVGSASFLLYVWKDVHVVILLEALWSFANLVFPTETARWAYGLFCASGSLGGITGNLSVGKLADVLGTTGALWLLAPVFAIEILLVMFLAREAGHPAPKDRPKAGLDDLRLLTRSRYLGWMLVMVGLVQIVVTMIDFVYNQAIAEAYPVMDERTAIIGRVYAVIDAASLSLQLGTGIVLRFAGLRATLLGIPSLLGTIVVAFAVHPRFLLMAATKAASKIFDYSLFRAAKEILYIPLGYAEKTRGKALIDMLTYRVAKGGASFLLLGLVAVGATDAVLPVIVALVVAWLAVTLVVTRRHAALRSEAAVNSEPTADG
jgi:ATP/ADP translocase